MMRDPFRGHLFLGFSIVFFLLCLLVALEWLVPKIAAFLAELFP